MRPCHTADSFHLAGEPVLLRQEVVVPLEWLLEQREVGQWDHCEHA